MDNLVLIGMPGVGKSTVGVVLAKAIGYEFLDSDLLIQKSYGKRLSELIDIYGTEGFIRLEECVNSAIDVRKTVIATGGSAVYGERAMRHLKDMGKVIYLRLSYESLRERLGDLKDRGVVSRKGTTLKELFDERTPLYEKYADIVIDENGFDIRRTVEKLRELIDL